MFTVVVSYHAENAADASAKFAEHIRGGGHNVFLTEYTRPVKPGDGLSATVTHKITSKEPESLFNRMEEYASGGVEIPDELVDVYFEGLIYYIHAMPKDVTNEQMMYILNIALNAACINRTNYNNLRNMYLTDRHNDAGPTVEMLSLRSIQEAVNILSNKVLGVELLTTINNKEEVKWPVH
ncbi:hypothetical protein HQ81_0017 [Dickeya phage phiDP23.1]|uniref:Uncharacterized protein n=17 Tax=Aglimvirinae TaxID=2169530 RepID=I0J2R6_9CAUD|nr:hypothetical protein G379_gp168 [Dickeya phage vB-DsoM-LIMEstone1]YP_009102849.1 hypothetical protein DA66_0009 [Dickeya phage RC-2014]AIM51354.1 hypothetical protein HQ80_0040 [Dickeya phage phiD3]AIM51542.1 hypothetical protein HQ82_0092 [Dickeya phage phiDP10.3]AIM51921.1 hypothetical protein HQ81_0017 [Dickeya phage phiDP23.1]ASD51226.1 hypothetical protein [Dickeya phage JA15]ASD51425.1 hypothetical protein [Dickeya phage XF4]ATW62045.1 hypothetical protein [Dickeya phage PP35]AYN55